MLTILCISSYEKGFDFMREAKALGCRVILLTSKSLGGADWPRESLDEIFYIPDKNKDWDMQDVIYGVSYLARTENIDRIVALDDFDVERAASLREHLRIAGMGDTTARHFRDKLAMRMVAKEKGIPVPEFLHLLNHKKINEFAETVPFPYMIKPRLLAGSYGLKKVTNKQEMWDRINHLADEQSFFLMERFVPGNIYHVDTIINDKEVVFGLASKYGTPPFEVAHDGRVFTSKTLDSKSDEAKEVLELNKKVLKALGLLRGVSHSEFIRDENGKLYFLETSSRVGGANLSSLVEAATGINLWREWAKIEILNGEKKYKLPKVENNFAAILNSLSKQEWSNLDAYNDPEVWWRLKKEYHAGVIIKSSSEKRIEQLLDEYTKRFYNDFFTSAKMAERPSD
ncbi:MAG: ATP-grasp domain-containing protein [Ignavibacteriota bacterium]